MIRKLFFPVRSTGQGLVIVSRTGTPLRIPFKKASSMGLFTVTRYSFSWRFPARIMRFTRSPSFVRRRSPWESLSRRPTGYTRRGYFKYWVTVISSLCCFVLQTIPLGLLKSRRTFFAFFFMGVLSKKILSFVEIFSPLTAARPFTVTRFSEIRRSASLLEHTPASLKYLLILIFSSICLLYNFFARAAMGNSLVFFGRLLYDKNEYSDKLAESLCSNK